MRRAIFAKADGVVRQDVDDFGMLQRRHADRIARIVREDQEGAAIGNHAPVQRHAVHRRGHAELANAVIDIASAIVVGGQRGSRLGLGVVRTGEVGAAADHRFQRLSQHAQGHFAGLAGGDGLRFRDQIANVTFDRFAGGDVRCIITRLAGGIAV